MATEIDSIVILFVLFTNVYSEEFVLGSRPPRIFEIVSNWKISNHQILLKDDRNEEIRLHCHVEDGTIPKPAIQWYKNGNILDISMEGFDISETNVIRFLDPDMKKNQGYYHCEAQNSLGLAKSEAIHLSPKKHDIKKGMNPPKFTTEGKPEVEIKEIGRSADFQCIGNGFPKPNIVWTFNGKKMDNFNDQEKLTIPSISPENIGTYACNISNEAGYEYKMVYLDILTTEPTFVETPTKNQIVSVGQKTFLRCKVKAYPPASIRWFFEEDEIFHSDEYRISNGDLIIEKAQAQMEGTYECLASNVNGKSSVKANLTIVNSTKIISGPKDLEAKIGSAVVMNCSVSWDPLYDLKIVWRRENVEIEADDERIINGNNSLTIKNVNPTDRGVYTCIASTDISTDSDSATLMVTGMSFIPPKSLTQLDKNYTLIIVMIVIVSALLWLIIMTSVICVKIYWKKQSKNDSRNNLEDIENIEDTNRLISNRPKPKRIDPDMLDLYPVILEERSSSESSPLASNESVNENVTSETDKIDQELEGAAKLEWDDGVFFQFSPGNLRMFGESFNFDHESEKNQ